MSSAFVPRLVGWAGVVPRIRGLVGARRLVPTWLALLATDVFYNTLLRVSPRRMDLAVEAMAAVLGPDADPAELRQAARAHIAARARGWELTFRPWALDRVPVVGAEHLHRAKASGRGLLLSKSHLGPLAAWVPLGGLLGPVLLPADGWLLDEPDPGYDGYRVEHRRRLFHRAGIRLEYANRAAMLIYKTLRGGGAVLMSMDMPGERTTEFLGKPVDLVDGTAELAGRTGALVVPVALMPRGRRWEIRVLEPLDPRDFDSTSELHLALVRVHERLILEAPEHLENPLWRWPDATPEVWPR